VSTSERPNTGRVARILSRDTLSFLLGWYLIIYQAQFAPVFNTVVFAGGLVIVGVPGAAAAWTGRLGGTPTGPPPSASPPDPSSGVSSS